MWLTEKDEARFWAKVALPDANGCMLWLSGTREGEYGCFRLQGRIQQAHRISYELAYGPIPEGLVIDHVKAKGCVSTLCVAPDHLEAVTRRENTRRGEAGAHEARKTHCPAGHPYTPENTYTHPKSGRYCRTCHRRQSAAHRARRVLPIISEEAPRGAEADQ